MPRFKLHYFKIRGRAESSRILLALAGADWEDVRVEYSDFTAIKESDILPYGQMPILEVDGKVLGQSMAIFRYIAREHGLVPPTSLQVAIADSIVDQLEDCFGKVIQAYHEKDAAKKEELQKKFKEDTPKYLKYFEKILKENNNGKTFFFGEKMTYPDVQFFFFWNQVNKGVLEVPEFIKDDFPDLAKLYEAVMNEPAILAYLNKRPTSNA